VKTRGRGVVCVSLCPPDHPPHLHPIKYRATFTVKIFLSINRQDLVKKESGKSGHSATPCSNRPTESTTNGHREGRIPTFYTERLTGSSGFSTRLLAVRGVTRLFRGEVAEAIRILKEPSSKEVRDRRSACCCHNFESIQQERRISMVEVRSLQTCAMYNPHFDTRVPESPVGKKCIGEGWGRV
jgi:hypothetical protein